MRLTNIEIVKLLKPRLGFGAPPVSKQEATTQGTEPLFVQQPGIPHFIPTVNELDGVDDAQLSLLQLADELEMALNAAPSAMRVTASENLKELAGLFQDPGPRHELPPMPAPSKVPDTTSKGLEGCKVAAVGFGRQDISGLAAAMIDRRARIEFLPRGESSSLTEFDLLILNAASTEILKREAASYRDLLAMGIPSILTGSRAALNILRDCNHLRNWDFVAKPIHMDELAWRAVNLLTRQDDLANPRRMPARVVVADQDPFTRTLVESAMKQLGIECELAEEGDAAWEAVERSKPGALILDLTLPNRDGFQLMADIRRSPGRKPKVLVLSARQSEADILRAFALGADDYISKPFSPLELSARLTRLLGGAPADA